MLFKRNQYLRKHKRLNFKKIVKNYMQFHEIKTSIEIEKEVNVQCCDFKKMNALSLAVTCKHIFICFVFIEIVSKNEIR